MATRRRKPANRPNKRGTLFIERSFPQPLGELRMASGTHDPQTWRDMDDMLTALAESVPPRWDILQAIKAKALHPLYALSLYKQGQLQMLPAAVMLPPLQPTWTEWMEAKHCSEEYRKDLRLTLGHLLRHGTEPKVGELPQLLWSYRRECVADGKPVQFNRAKAHAQSFVKDTLRRRNPLYAEVADVDRMREEDVLRRPQKPEALHDILQLLPEPYRQMAWELAVTGMRPKEYFDRDWAQEAGVLQVIKGKTKAARRRIPLWAGALVGPQRKRDAFEDAWDSKIGALLGIYDLRRSFMVWMEDAGIPRSRRRIYFGHAVRDVSDLYEQRELDQWMVEDAARLRAYAPELWRWINAPRPETHDAGDDEGEDGGVAQAAADAAGKRRAAGSVGDGRA